MKRAMVLHSLLLFVLILSPLTARGDRGTVEERAIRQVTENAQWASDNAHIYQWKRVDLEVERVTAGTRTLDQTMHGAAAHHIGLRQLQAAVKNLRRGRAHREPSEVVEAAHRVLSAVKSL